MKKKQLQAGYVLKSVYNSLNRLEKGFSVKPLFEHLSTFNIYYDFIEEKNDNSITAILNNLISRGLPTFPSIFIEDTFLDKLKMGEKVISDRTGDILYQYNDNLNIDLIYKSLFTIDPRINGTYNTLFNFDSWEEHSGSDYEEIFFQKILPDELGDCYKQCLETQREINSILNLPEESKNKLIKKLQIDQNRFFEQRVDFSFQFPHYSNFKDGLVIEIDGSQHEVEPQKSLDDKRNEAVEKKGWKKTVRIKTSEVKSNIDETKIEAIKCFLEHPYAQRLKENYENKIWEEEFGLEALQFALTPIAIARIQKTLIFLINSNILKMNARKWNIAIIERDVPCGFLAVNDLKNQITNLFDLEGKGKSIPKINLKIYNTEEFSQCQLNMNIKTELVSKPINNFKADVVLDIATLQRFGFNKVEKEFEAKVNYRQKIIIRSIHSISHEKQRKVISAKPIKFKISMEEQPKPLVYFLQNIFRKNSFRDGQVEILRRTLNLKDVIALLPTGAGKSLTYQLSALLQPGIVIIVDPLKSLMRDQNDNLISYGIDSTVFINSSLKANERKIATENMINGLYQFVFISPERFQIAEFRSYLEKMGKNYFTYCVVDEAHCVSEWGHDFRTAYLRLGKNSRKYCKVLNYENELKNEVPIIALTGTASFDVLKDVRIELDLNEFDEELIISPLKYERPELEYIVIKADNIANNINSKFEIEKAVANKKQDKLIEILNDLPKRKWENGNYENLSAFFDNNLEYKNSGIVFCPHATDKFGVKDICGNFINRNNEFYDITRYYASKLSNEINLEEIQDQFKKDELLLLITTNAFGMGIDKPNIRFTIHFNMPQSIESFYQEAGRAGRDKLKAYNYIIYSEKRIKEKFRDKEETHTVDKSLMLSFFYNSFRGEEKEKRILYNLFDKVTYPDKRNIDYLNELVEENFDTDFKLKIWFGIYFKKKINAVNNWLYINTYDDKSYGFIDLYEEECRFEYKKKDKFLQHDEEALKFVKKIYIFLKKQKTINDPNNSLSFREWILSRKSKDSVKGIEKTLSGMKLNEQTEITIGFNNKKFQEVAEILGKNDTAWDENLVSKANGYAFKFSNFIENLRRVYKKKTKSKFNLSVNQQKLIEPLYANIRDESDTFKAVYRLSIIGVIDEYEVDYKFKIIKVTISKKTDEEYIKNIIKYVAKYAIKDEINKVKQDILDSEGNTVLHKCCNYLVDYVYATIAKKRKNAINTMEEAIVNGFDNLNYFKSQINTYFDSKYLPGLLKSFKENKIETVWYFITDANDLNSLKHLEGACRRLLDDNPDSPVLLLLRSYSRFLLDINIEQTKLDFTKAWDLLKEQKNWKRNEYLKNFSKFYDYIIQYDKSMEGYLNPILINEHNNWFKEFNKKILEGVL